LSSAGEPGRQAVLAGLVAAIERLTVDLAVSEEPAGFLAALAAGAPAPDRSGASPAGPGVAPPPGSP
jgi:hypothetical protein